LHAFSGNVIVSKGEDVLFEKSYGFSNIEHNVLNEPDTKFRIWSITKQFTAVGILLLEEKGMLNTEDFLVKYFEGFDSRITLHHLLNHSSGIFNYSDDEQSHETFQRMSHKSADLLKLFKGRALDFDPGTDWNYSNTGYYLLGQIIEKVTGKSFVEFINDSIVKPLGLTGTGVDDGKKLLQKKAVGYYLNNDELINCNYIDMKLMSSSGGMYSTTSDLIKWSNALKTNSLISKKSIDKMMKPYNGDYGYGLFINSSKARVSHGGGCEGFLSELHMYNDGLSIAVLSNYGFTAVFDICENLADIFREVDYSKPSKPKKIENGLSNDFLGSYREPDFTLDVIKTASGYNLIMDGKTTLKAYASSNDTLVHDWIDERYVFDKSEDGNISIWGVDKV